jgi:competence protein ComGC
MTTRGKTSSWFISCFRGESGYTLFEILLALGIVAILLGTTVPLIMTSWQPSAAEEISQNIEKSVQAAHKKAVETGEARRLRILESGLTADSGLPSVNLPKGWKLQVRRFTESRYRKPQRDEYWNFNGAGICDPLELRLVSKQESIVLKFDPLTALLVVDDN